MSEMAGCGGESILIRAEMSWKDIPGSPGEGDRSHWASQELLGVGMSCAAPEQGRWCGGASPMSLLDCD